MIKTIDDYIDAAKKCAGPISDRELARRLGFKSNCITHWRTRRTWPDDSTIVDLARLAGLDPHAALIELNTWRADDKTRPYYARLADKVSKIEAVA